MNLVLLLVLLFLPFSGVKAHRLNIFAYYEDGEINIESFFSDGTPCRNCRFSIVDEKGNVLKQGVLDDKGQAIVQMSLKKGMYIRVNASMGHLATFHLNPGALPETSTKGENGTEDIKLGITKEELREIIRKEMQDQLRPIIMELARLKEDRFPKIVAAFGYIVGVFGFLALLKSRGRS